MDTAFSDKLIHEAQQMSNGTYLEWAWTTLQANDQSLFPHIENMCLECGAVNVDKDHECEGKQVA